MAEDEELIVRLRAEIDDLNDKLNQAKESINGFTEEAGDMFDGLGQRIVEAFSIYEIAKFVKESISAFAEYEEKYQQLQGVIERSGTSWDSVKDKVHAYTEEIAANTKFSEEDAISVLNKMMIRTNDLTTSVNLNNLAMKIAKTGAMDYTTAGNALALAYEGNTRGLAQLSRAFGITGENAKDATKLFAVLESKMKDVDAAQQNTVSTMASTGHAFKEFYVEIGSDLAPVFDWLMGKVKVFVNLLRSIPAALANIAGKFYLTFMDMADQAAAFGTFLANVWKHPIDAWKQYNDKRKELWEKTNKDIEGLDQQTGEELIKIWDKTSNALPEKFTLAVGKLTPKLKEVKKAVEDDVDKPVKDAGNTVEDTFTVKFLSSENLANAAFQGLGYTFEGFVGEMKAGTLTISKAFAELAGSIASNMIQAVGDSLIQMGAGDIAKGAAMTLNPLTAAGAPGFFLQGAEEEAAGGVIKGIAATFLAEGGVVNKPALIVAGEAGPEAIMPLDKMGFGDLHIHGGLNLHLPNVKNPKDFSTQTTEIKIMQTLGNAYQRLGQKGKVY